MSERGTVRFGKTRIAYDVVRSPRRQKTIELTLDGPGRVIVAAPVAAGRDRIEAVIRRRAGWIIRHGNNGATPASPKRFVSGETLPYLGREVRMFVRTTSSGQVNVRFDHWSFHVTVPRALDGDARHTVVRQAFERWYRERAEAVLPPRVARWSKRAGVTPSGLLVRDQRQRWASCSPDGVLRFNWRAMMLPSALLDYVVVHELCHLQHRTHSSAYWRDLARALPDSQLRRLKLSQLALSL